MEYMGYLIEDSMFGYTVYYHGDEVVFETLEGAKEFIEEVWAE